MGLFDTIRRWLGGDVEEPAAPAVSPEIVGTPPFPYPLVTVHGEVALAKWTELRGRGDCWPVILGSDEDVDALREGITDIEDRAPAEILAVAAGLSFPASLAQRREEDDRRARAYLGLTDADLEGEDEPELGDWPDLVEPVGLTVASHYTGQVYDRVHIALLPCSTGWEAIAHLGWGNWNSNPAAEYHVAALRAWHERYGAELVGCSRDVLNLRVTRRPATREEALDLAREQYLYCNDIVDQGVGSLAALAATLMEGDWWFFWWD